MASGYLSLGLVLLLLLVYGLLQVLHIPVGNFLDWVIGAASFGWLLVIVTVPWNIHYDAKEALAEAMFSVEKGIPVDEKQVRYVQMVAKRSLWVVITLHLLSAIGLYGLAISGISPIGYISSGAALLLTALRPAIQTYRYFATRISLFRQQFKYPREDVMELRQRVLQLEEAIQRLDDHLDLENPASWAIAQQRQWDALRQDLTMVSATLSDLKATNQADHDRLSRESRQAIAQLSTDGQFLDHVREIIRFFKTA